MLNVIPMVTTKKTVTEYTEKETRIETCQYIYAQLEHKFIDYCSSLTLTPIKEDNMCCAGSRRESANFLENSICYTNKIWRERQRDEMAHIKFIEAVVRAKSPNLSGWLFVLTSIPEMLKQHAFGYWGAYIEAGSQWNSLNYIFLLLK